MSEGCSFGKNIDSTMSWKFYPEQDQSDVSVKDHGGVSATECITNIFGMFVLIYVCLTQQMWFSLD